MYIQIDVYADAVYRMCFIFLWGMEKCFLKVGSTFVWEAEGLWGCSCTRRPQGYTHTCTKRGRQSKARLCNTSPLDVVLYRAVWGPPLQLNLGGGHSSFFVDNNDWCWHGPITELSIENSRALCPGGRFPPSFIHQVIIITGLKLYDSMFWPWWWPSRCR